MNSRLLLSYTVLILTLHGCATPAPVKQLSLKQLEYFNTAIEALSLQSEVLILAVEKLVSHSRENIDAIEKKNKARFETLIQKEITQEDAKRVLAEVSETTEIAMVARAKLDSNFSVIKEKAEELKIYLMKMKEVHQALDAYIQSEKAGEKFVNDVLNQKSVNTLIKATNDLIPKIKGGIRDVETLLNGM